MDFNNIDLKKEYDKLLVQRRCGLRNVMQRLENIKDVIEHEYLEDGECRKCSPFDTIKSRIKTYESTCEKISRKGWEMNVEGLEKVHDIAGIRIVTPFIDDVYALRDILYDLVDNTKPKNTMRIVEERDYIEHQKPSGYRSLHLLVEVKISAKKGVKPKWTPVEIQIRTKNMDNWSYYEHMFKYKNPHPSPDAEKKLLEAAKMLSELDQYMVTLRDENLAEAIGARKSALSDSN